MGVFGAVFGRRGDVGFSGPLLWVCSGVVGFNVAMFLRPVREICRPARPDVGASAKYFALLGLMWARARKSSPRKPKMGKICCFRARWAKFFAETRLEGLCWASFFAYQQSWDPAGRVCCAAGLVAALLLAVLTLPCAAKPYWWHGGQPARSPPIGLVCVGRGPGHHLSGQRASDRTHVRRMRSQKQKSSLAVGRITR